MLLHGSCAALGEEAVLLLGQPGSGKSDLLLRLIDRGFRLVGDDQVLIDNGMVRAPDALAGMIEIRGVGIFVGLSNGPAWLNLVVQVGRETERLPHPRTHPTLHRPELTINPWTDSAPLRIQWALDAIAGRRRQASGAFAA